MNNEHPLISVVTPVYNAEAFVMNAYECLQRQTYPCWEWVVVDDGSTDDSAQRLQQLAQADNRVRYIAQPNSGSAKQPRDHAVCEARGEWILFLDIDDQYVEDEYIEQMWQRHCETDAQIVYPLLSFTETDGRRTLTLPTPDIDTTRVYAGLDLVAATLPDWHIGCNGGLYHRSVWVNLSWPSPRHPIYTNSDEVDERLFLLEAQRVAFAHVNYLYIQHPQSITHYLSLKRFHQLFTDVQLRQIIVEAFGPDSDEYHRMQQKIFNTFRSLLAFYLQHRHAFAQQHDSIDQAFRMHFRLLERQHFSLWNRLRFLDFRSYDAVYAIFKLKYKEIKN